VEYVESTWNLWGRVKYTTFEEFENHVNDRRYPDILSAEDLFSVELVILKK
jgi:hypothetical protein